MSGIMARFDSSIDGSGLDESGGGVRGVSGIDIG